MAHTRNWVNTDPIDHTKFKAVPGEIREKCVDVEERLTAFFYGFASGETSDGIKYLPFWAQTTAPGSAANCIIPYGSDVAGKTQLVLKDEDGNVIIATLGGILNSLNLEGNQTVAGVKTFTSNPLMPSTAPTTDLQVSHKKYVDDMGQAAGGDLTGIYPNPTIDAAKVSQAKLKTSLGEVSTATGSLGANLTLPGGEYGFYPQIKGTFGAADSHACGAIAGTGSFVSGSYVTNILLSAGSGTVYAQQRYVTASGKDHWIFLLVEKVTGKKIAAYQAPDHPSANQGVITELDLPHPFASYDPEKHEIVLADNSVLKMARLRMNRRRSLLTILNEDMVIDDTKRPHFEPREIIKINEFPKDPVGKVIRRFKTPSWAKVAIRAEEITLERRMVEKVAEDILYKQMVLKG